MDRQERINRAKKHALKRLRLINQHGLQSGTMYEKHVNKIKKSLGYVRDGNISHYALVGFGYKTRDRNRYGKVYDPPIRDKRHA